MPATEPALPTLDAFLAEPLRVGEPDSHGALAVFPLFAAPPRLEYVAFADGCARGLTIKELDHGASVNDLMVLNPTDVNVLLYEGEEVLGAQQNRTFDVSVLVAAGAALRVPVSCVEHGRWDGSRHAETFSPAPQAAYPELRRMKNRAARARVTAGLEARADQRAVWDEVADKSARHDVGSPTHAMHDMYEHRRGHLSEFVAAIRLHPAQTGALVAIGGRMTVLDHVSRPEAFATLHAPLVQGYALDAIEAADLPAPTAEEARGFVDRLARTRVTEHDGMGLGRDARFGDGGVSGAALVAGDELVQLTAFADDAPATPRTRIRRPSRRR
jgi:hypothetical protein